MKKHVVIGLLICQMVTGCAANSVPGKIEQISATDDVYQLTIRRKSYTTLEYNDKKFKQTVQSIMDEHDYTDYRILNVENDVVGGKDTYKIKFYKPRVEPVE